MVLGILLFSSLGVMIVSSFDLLVVSVTSCFLLLLSMSGCEVDMGEALLDPISQPMLGVSIILTAMSISLFPEGKGKILILMFSLIVTELFFLVKSLIAFFVFFELSLVPMFFLILGWGKSSERIEAGKYMIMYTLVASAPLLCVLLSLEGKGFSLAPYSPFSEEEGGVFVLFGLFAFLVKAPMFVFHSWLPRAHVEAPLEGSMILAGVMLKVGLYGLIRMSSLIPPWMWGMGKSILLSTSLLGSVYSILLAISSDDLKISVAFSSVSHMNMCISGFLSLSHTALSGCVLTMIAHGLVSPMMFLSVTLAYQISHSRSVLINKGVLGMSPHLKVFILLIWAMNMALPPFVSFLGEVKLFSGLIFLSSLSGVAILSFLVFGSMFSALNFGILTHSGSRFEKGVMPMFIPMALSIFVSVSMFLLFFTVSE